MFSFLPPPITTYNQIYSDTLTAMMELVSQLIGPSVDHPNTPECRIVAAGTIDGSATINGNSQQLGNELDTALLLGLRQWSDCILVGAGTVRAENYGQVLIPKEIQKQRQDRGQHPTPPLIIVSRSLHFPTTSRLFSHDGQPQVAITDLENAQEINVEKLTQHGWEIINVPRLTATGIIQALTDRGFRRIISEGGPQLNSALLAARLVTKIHLTLDPLLCLSTTNPLFGLGTSDEILPCTLEHVHHSNDGNVFLRYGINR